MMVRQKASKKSCSCPYCDAELVKPNLPLCQACGVKISYCPDCRQPLPRNKKVCPNCGAKVKA